MPNSSSRGQYRCSCRMLANIELELPTAPVASDAPDLQLAGFGDHCFERYRNHLALVTGERHFHRRELFNVVAGVINQVAGVVVLALRRGQESELRRLADIQSELAV